MKRRPVDHLGISRAVFSVRDYDETLILQDAYCKWIQILTTTTTKKRRIQKKRIHSLLDRVGDGIRSGGGGRTNDYLKCSR